MKLLLTLIFVAMVVGAVMGEEPQPSQAAAPAPAPAPAPADPAQDMERDAGGIDPIYAEYENKAKELYVKALIDYYHAHPSRLESDLSQLTSAEYSLFVPSQLMQQFHVDRAAIEAKIAENDRIVDHNDEAEIQAQEEEEDQHEMQTNAEDDTDFETSQFGRFGGFGFGRGFGFGFRRFGFGFPYGGGFYGGGYGYPYGGFGYGGGYGGKKGGYGGYGGYGGFGYGFPGYGYGGFGFGRRFGFI